MVNYIENNKLFKDKLTKAEYEYLIKIRKCKTRNNKIDNEIIKKKLIENEELKKKSENSKNTNSKTNNNVLYYKKMEWLIHIYQI